MTERLVSAAWAALIGALAGVLLLAVFYLLRPSLRVEFDIDPPRLMTGMHRGERDDATGLTFAWTSRDVAIRLPGVDRRVGWTLRARLRGGRSNPADNPAVVFFVDGVRTIVHQSRIEFDDIELTLPARLDRPRGALITIQSSTTFVPGPQDPRPLGVMVDRITLTPTGLALPPWAAFAGSAWSGAAFGAGIALLGVTPGLAVGAAVVIAVGQASVLSRGFAPYTDYPAMSARLAVTIAAALVVLVCTVERVRGQRLRNTARFAAAFTAIALFLKLLVLLHPNMPLGDALFQAHRFQEVLRGNYYFTSIAPGDYQFPYAPGLYVTAMPFADLVRRESGDVVLLRIVVASMDAIAAVLLYLMVAHAWGDRRAAAGTTAIYHLLPLDFGIAIGGTLTSGFAQSLAGVGLVLMSARWLQAARVLPVVALTIALAAAFMSHTSTFAILSVATFVVALVFAARGGPGLRFPAVAIAAAGVAAVVLSVVLYYGHFIETYRTEFSRITKETTTAAADAGGRSIGERAMAVPRYLREYLGIPALLLATAGAVQLWRQGARDRLTLAIAGWVLTCLAFLVIGVATPVDMRYYLAALPALAALAALGASSGWRPNAAHRIVTVGLLAWCTWLGIQTWWNTLR